MLRKSSIAVVAFVAASCVVTAASAHPQLRRTAPAADSSASTSPTEIRLSFSEGVIPKFSGVDVKDQAGKAVPTGKAATDPKDGKQLIVPLQGPLAPGTYLVNWHAVSVDTHRVKGTYSFKVQP